MTELYDTDITIPKVIILGIFGNHKVTESDLQENTLNLILQELGQIPNRILIPTEGYSSIYIQSWAESLHIPFQLFQSDWIKNGKIAQILRDDRIQKECTHALVFLSPKSNKLEKLAEKMAKKGKTVFTSSCHTQELQQLCVERPQKKALEPCHKLGKRKEQLFQQYQK
jgi:hypothetical protein